MSRSAITPSLETSQQSHIDDLVQRNRKHEQTIRQIKDELAQEKSRAKITVHDIQNKLHAEKREWREACDTLQACHRIHQLRLQVELEKQRSSLLAEQELLRKEKVATVQREFAITKFQIQESQMDRRILELEDELAEVGHLHDEERHAFKARISKVTVRLEMQEEQLNASEQTRASLEAELNKLHKANAESQVSSETLLVKLERTTLQLDGERSKTADLERINNELKRSNDELKRQVAKWQSLESKGDTEIETERKKRVELEVELQAVQNQLNKQEEHYLKAEKRTEKAKQYLDDWKNHAETLQSQLEELQKKFAKSERVNKQLVSEIDSMKELRNPRNSLVESEEEVAHVMSQAVPSSPAAPILAAGTSRRRITSNKPSSKSSPRQISKGSAPAAASSQSSSNTATRELPHTRGKGKNKSTVVEPDSDADTEIRQLQKKPRPQPKPRSKQAALAHDSDIEIILQEDFTEGKRRQGKRKASPLSLVDEEGDEEVRASAAPVKRRKRNVDTERPQPKFKTRGGSKPSTIESTASTVTVDPEPEDSTSQKNGMVKKRKINLFQPSGKMDLANLDFGSQGSGIPSVLSPLKPEQAVPARSTSFLSFLKR